MSATFVKETFVNGTVRVFFLTVASLLKIFDILTLELTAVFQATPAKTVLVPVHPLANISIAFTFFDTNTVTFISSILTEIRLTFVYC